MKMTRFAILTVFVFMTITCVIDTPAQASPQYNLPMGATASFGRGTVTKIAYSPDGTRLAVAAQMGIWIYDAQTRAELDMLPGKSGGISDIAYSPDGRVLACATGGEVWLWDTISGQLKTPLSGQITRVEKVAFSPDGTTLASSSEWLVQLWNTKSWQRKGEFRHATAIVSIAFSPDGTMLAGGSTDETVRLWNVVSGKLKATLNGHTDWVTSVAFSPDGTTLAANKSNEIHLWDVATGRTKATLNGHTTGVRSVAFSPDGRTLASGSYDTTVRLWDVATGRTKATLNEHTGWIQSVAFSPNGRTIASGGNEIHFWDAASGQIRGTLADYTSAVESVAFSPDDTTVASGSDNGVVRLWDVVTGQHKTTFSHPGAVKSVAFSPNGRTFASGGSGIHLWDVATGQRKGTLTAEYSLSVAFSPDGTLLASGTRKGAVRLWDVATGRTKATFNGHTDGVRSVAFSPDGRTLASGSYDTTVRLWDVATGRTKATLTGHTDEVRSVAFSPDGRTLASGSMEIHLWETTTGKHKTTIKGTFGFASPVSVVFSSDGQTIASQGAFGGEVKLWDAVSGQHKLTFPEQPHYVSSLAFSSDGTTLASGNREGVVFLWKPTPTSSPLPHPMVRVIYFRPRDSAPQENIDTTLDTFIKETQEFYAMQMEKHEFGRKTFTFETDASGNARVHHVKGQRTAADYLNDSTQRIVDELNQQFLRRDHIYLVALDRTLTDMLSGYGMCGIAYLEAGAFGGRTQQQKLGGFAIIPAAGNCFTVGIAAHEIGHTAGLSHDFRDDRYIMSYGSSERLSYEAAQWLDAHPCWNPDQPRFNNTLTTIEVRSTRASRLQFHVTDADGLQQAQLIVIESDPTFHSCGYKDQLQGSKVFNGNTSSTFEFVVPQSTTNGVLKVMDVYGNIATQKFSVETDSVAKVPDVSPAEVEPARLSGDVNGDGIVNLEDMDAAADRLGQTGENTADMDGNGIVDAADLLLIAAAIEQENAAPSLHSEAIVHLFTAAEVRQWLQLAQQQGLTSLIYQRGFLVLEQLLALLTPTETVLLSNYPNPFNPETWIPYHLSNAAEVHISIYAADRKLVRRLCVGHQAAGIYESRSRAAYWDGRNALGESVASGVYFYTLTAGDFAATRKLLIEK